MPLGSNKAGLFGAAGVSGGGDRGIYAGGIAGNVAIDSIEYVTISSTGNGTDFGDMMSAGQTNCCANGADGGRGIITRGRNEDPDISYITVQTLGNAVEFGNQHVGADERGTVSNGSNDRGLFMGGYDGARTGAIEYITVSSTGNGADFGDLSAARRQPFQAASNGTDERGITMGGESASVGAVDIIEYVTINSAGNSTDFGDMNPIHKRGGSCSNDTNDRMVTGGGGNFGSDGNDPATTPTDNFISYITMTSTGNTTDFGNLTSGRGYPCCFSSGTDERGVWAGGYYTPDDVTYSMVDVIDYVTISSTGDATDFGDLADNTGYDHGGLSDCQA